jgi:DNA-binding NarL/FixJ family response regulator
MSEMPEPKPAPRRRMRILVVDDHSIVRRGLRDLIAQEVDLEVCAEAANPKEAIAAIELEKPDVALIDLMMDGVSGFDFLKTLKEQYAAVRVLVLSMHDESYYAERCMRAGARGYIMKQEASDQIVKAIRTVADGRIHLSEEMSGKLLNVFLEGKSDRKSSSIERLSDRELQVFELLGQGQTTRSIAEKLHLSIKTVETHRLNIMSKLRIENPNELIRKAVHWVESGRSEG